MPSQSMFNLCLGCEMLLQHKQKMTQILFSNQPFKEAVLFISDIFVQGLQLWEALWSCPYTSHFHIYMCAAVLRMHRRAILQKNMSFDELLSFCILLSGKIDLGRTMRVAEKIFKSSGETGRQCLKALEITP